MLQRLIKGLDDLENEKRRYLIMSSDVEISEISDEELKKIGLKKIGLKRIEQSTQ